MKTAFIVLLSILAICSKADLISDMLTAHNTLRSKFNIQPLTWNSKIASQAQDWATYLAKNDLRAHSGTDGVGENLARGSAGKYSPTRLFGLWESEKQYFIPGRNYPDCSTTGSKSDVGHYTQLVWATTTEVGCGFADLKKAVLVCQYKEPGNKIGKPVYSTSGNNPQTNTNTNSGSNTNTNTNSGSSNSGSTNSGSNTNTNTNSGSNTNTNTNSGSNTNTNTNSGSNTNTNTNTGMPTTSFRGISWSQYKGRIDSSSDFWAYTIWNAPYTYRASTSGSTAKLTVDARCELDQSDSWVRSQYKSDDLLRHEQGHYYIGSIFAMTFKKQAESTTFSKSNYKSEVAKLYNNLLDQFLDYERRYDSETEHFNNKDMQKKWEADLINQINALKAYWW